MTATINGNGKSGFLNAQDVISTESNTLTMRESVKSVFPSRPSDATPAQTLRLIEQSTTLDFWADEEEDVYTRNDGEPI